MFFLAATETAGDEAAAQAAAVAAADTAGTAAPTSDQSVHEMLAEEGFGFWEILLVKLIGVAIIVGIALVVYKLLKIPINRLLGANDQRKVGGSIFLNLVRVLVWGTAFCLILDLVFDLDIAGILGAAGVLGIAVSLGAQQTIANVIGGVIVSLSRMVGPGDWIKVQGYGEGRVIDTNWRRTTLEDENGIFYAVPNSVMVGNIVEKGNPFYMIVVPFSLKVTTPDVEGLLVECEQALLDRQIEGGFDYEQMRPKAHVEGVELGAIRAEVKLYVDREHDSRYVKRAVLPALINLLQERDALANLSVSLEDDECERAPALAAGE